MIGICTDSSSQLSAELAGRYKIEVVPLTVSVDDHEFLEGVDIDADELYTLLASSPDLTGRSVQISEPSAGQYAAAYEDLLARGCTEILSIHSSGVECNTTSAARMAARSVPVPVRLVQVATHSFGVSCCVWAAAEAIAGGASLDAAMLAVEEVTASLGHVFTMGEVPGVGGDHGFAVLTGHGDDVRQLGSAPGLDETVRTMAEHILATGSPLCVGVGMASGDAGPLADALADALRGSEHVAELVRYRIGAGFAMHMRPNAVGCFAFPI